MQAFRIGRNKVLGLLAAVVAGALAYLSWRLWGLEGLVAYSLVAFVFGTLSMSYLSVVLSRKVRGEVAHHTAVTQYRIQELEQRMATPGELNEEMLRGINALAVRMAGEVTRSLRSEIRDEVFDEVFGQILDSVRAEVRSVVGKARERDKTERKRIAAEMDAIIQVHRLARFDAETPVMGGYALSPRGMLQIMSLARRPGVRNVLECGSGTSTVYIARMLQQKGEGRVVALEHLKEYAELTRQALSRLGLDDFAEVRLAQLETVRLGEVDYQWYSTAALEGLSEIHLMLVDGPPRSTGPDVRFAAVPLLVDRLADGAHVVVDDTDRKEESEMTDRLLGMFPLEIEVSTALDQTVLRVNRKVG